MAFDVQSLRDAVARHGRVARIVLAEVKGSSPREVGAAMLVWADGQSGTIGGGALEFELARASRNLTKDALTRHALGPDMGQCCGGAVRVLTEFYNAARVEALDSEVIARGPGDMPLAIKRVLAEARNQGVRPAPQLVQGWFVEPVHRAERTLWIWGAGHVGRAIVTVLAPLPDLAITWVDTGSDRFPADIPDGVNVVPVTDPAHLAEHAPKDASHLILTYSHALDLDLCHRLLQRGFGFCGLIGSKTKWARFQKRLMALGHSPSQIDQITCPIGDPALGKHPARIAIGVAAEFITEKQNNTSQQEKRA